MTLLYSDQKGLESFLRSGAEFVNFQLRMNFQFGQTLETFYRFVELFTLMLLEVLKDFKSLR